MGLCHSKKTLTNQHQTTNRSKQTMSTKDYGITKKQDTLTLTHAPLSSCQYLMEKFYYDSRRPEQINLMWQIIKVICNGKQIILKAIALKSVNIWIILGGQVYKNITGLYLKIKNCKQIQKSQLIGEECDGRQKQKTFVSEQRLQENDRLTVILESQNCKDQSLFLISNYQLKSGQFHIEQQNLQWNSLSFELNDIYGETKSQNADGDGDGEDNKCVICNEMQSNCILLPCRHLCIGQECLSEFKRKYKKCPLCKGQYEDILVYKKVQPI